MHVGIWGGFFRETGLGKRESWDLRFSQSMGFLAPFRMTVMRRNDLRKILNSSSCMLDVDVPSG